MASQLPVTITKPNLNSPNSLTHPSVDTFNNNQTLTERQEP
jgi:hypothetical protein